MRLLAVLKTQVTKSLRSKNSAASMGALCLTVILTLNSGLARAQSTAPQAFPLFPKYQVLGVVYAPPGAASSVTYSNSTMVGSSHSIVTTSSSTSTVTESTTSGFSFLGFGSTTTNTTSDSWTYSDVLSESAALTTTNGNSIATMGPVSSALGVNHDNDIIYIWLNPVMNTFLGTPVVNGSVTTYPIQWEGFQFNSCDLSDAQDGVNFYQLMNGCDPNQYPFPDIIALPVWCLKNPFYPGQSCAQWAPYVSRPWDLNVWGNDPVTGVPLGPGLTLQDYADILQADPFITQTLVASNSQTSQSQLNPLYRYTNPCHPTYGVNLDPNDTEVIPNPTAFLAPYKGVWPATYCGASSTGTSLAGQTMLRFDPFDTVQYPEPGVNGQPQTYSGSFSNNEVSTFGATATDTHTHSYDTNTSTSFAFTVSYGIAGFSSSLMSAGFNFGSSSGSGSSWTDAQAVGTTNTSSETNTASYSITGPALSDNYLGPTTFNVYKDNVYGTFAFYSDLQHEGIPIQLISTGLSSPIGVAFSGATAGCGASCFGSVTVGNQSAPITVTLTNNSPYQMTMVAPAVTFSDPGFQIVAGSDLCSNAPITSGGTCTLQIEFAPVVTDAPNTIAASYPASAYLVAAATENVTSFENILVTNTVITVTGTSETAVKVSGTAVPAATTCTTVTPFCDTGATLTPAPVSFTAYAGQTGTQVFTFTNYYSVPLTVNTSPAGVLLSSATDYSISSDSCSGIVVQPLKTCPITVKYTLPTTVSASAPPILNTKVTVAGTVLGSNVTLPVSASSAISTTVQGIGLSPASGSSSYVDISIDGKGSLTLTPLTVTVTNNSTGTLTLTSLSASTDFTNTVSTCVLNSAMAVGASCTIHVQVLPGGCSSSCSYQGTFTVNGTLGISGNPAIATSGNVTGAVVISTGSDVVISGAELSQKVTTPATKATGTITLKGSVATSFAGLRHVIATIGSFTAQANYINSATSELVAKVLATKLNVSTSPVTVTVSGDVITLKSKTAGTVGNLKLTTTGSQDFTLTPKSGGLSGGANAKTTMKYDGGSVKTTVGNVSGAANWGESSTPASIASDLASTLNAVANGAFTATVSGSTVTIAPTKGSPAPKVGVNVQDSKGFSPASFAAAAK
jgi:hypothetical protein